MEEYIKPLEMVILCVIPAMSDFGNAEAMVQKGVKERGEPMRQGKSRWHSYHVLVYIYSPVLTYLLGTVSQVL